MHVHFLYASAEHPAQGLHHVFECPCCRDITQWLGRHNRGDVGQHFEQLLLKFMKVIRKSISGEEFDLEVKVEGLGN